MTKEKKELHEIFGGWNGFSMYGTSAQTYICRICLGCTPGGGGVYTREFWIGVCREGSWTQTQFKD